MAHILLWEEFKISAYAKIMADNEISIFFIECATSNFSGSYISAVLLMDFPWKYDKKWMFPFMEGYKKKKVCQHSELPQHSFFLI